MENLAKVTGNIHSEKYREILEKIFGQLLLDMFMMISTFFRMTMPQCIDRGSGRSTEPLTIKNLFLGLLNHLISI